MTKVKYVPANATARKLSPSAVLIIAIGQGKVHGRALFNKGVDGFLRAPTLREADMLAERRGWVKLSSLPPSERAAWLAAHRKGRSSGKAQGLRLEPAGSSSR